MPGRRAARQRRRRRHRRRVSVRRPRRHLGREHWLPAHATSRRRPRAMPAHRGNAVGRRKPARQVQHSTAAPVPAAAGSVRQRRDAPAGARSGRHAASHHRATHGQARQNPSVRRAAARWQDHQRARHRGARGFAKELATRACSKTVHTHIASLSRINPTAMPSMANIRALVSTTIGSKSGFSAISSTMPLC